MTRDDIIAMALEAGLAQVMRHSNFTPWDVNAVLIERFANLVAAAEREACAEVAESFDACDPKHIVDAIRARGEA